MSTALPVTLTGLAIVSAGIYIWGSAARPAWLRYLLKPLTTLLILGVALSISAPITDLYRLLIAGGLIFSLGGDVALMLPQDLFVWGLVSFLVAHLFYLFAWRSRAGFHFTWWIFLVYLIYTVGLLYLLWPSLGSLVLPVAIYASVLMAMGWQAAEQYWVLRDGGAWLAMMGAALFMISDSTLAINKFRGPLRNQELIVMSTYWGAQLLIAWSVYRFGPA